MAKVTMGPEWTQAEREQLVSLMRADLAVLEEQETEWRKTILYEAPCFQENRAKREEIEQLIDFAMRMPQDFLEVNRCNFEDYLE